MNITPAIWIFEGIELSTSLSCLKLLYRCILHAEYFPTQVKVYKDE